MSILTTSRSDRPTDSEKASHARGKLGLVSDKAPEQFAQEDLSRALRTIRNWVIDHDRRS